jgi:hypothetical protein
MIKSRRKRWAEHVAGTHWNEEESNAVLFGAHEWKSSLVKPRSTSRLDNLIKLDHKDILWEVVDRNTSTEDRSNWSVFFNTVRKFGCHKMNEFLD